MIPYFSIAKRILKNIYADKRTISILVLSPIFILAIFGVLLNNEPQGIKIAVVNLDSGVNTPLNVSINLPDTILSKINRDTIKIERFEREQGTIPDLENELAKGKLRALIIFPEKFTETILLLVNRLANLNTTEPTIKIKLDTSEPVLIELIQKELYEAIKKSITTFGGTEFIKTETVSLNGAPPPKTIELLTPGIVSLSVLIITLVLGTSSIVEERTKGTLARLFVAPVKTYHIVLGYVLAYGALAIIQTALILSLIIITYNLTLTFNTMYIFLTVFIFSAGILGIAILISTVCRNVFQSIQMVPLIILPQVVLSNMFLPEEALPETLRYISKLFPLTYINNILKTLLLRSPVIENIMFDTFALIVFVVITLTLSTIILRKGGAR